jgi:glutamate-1-semialdehyde 2,1-aminomutase
MILAIIQARMKSTRLPGKVMKKILGRPMIGYLLERVSRAQQIDKIIVATSHDPANDVLVDYVESLGFDVFRGNENDTLDRFYQAAVQYSADQIIRITGDCPLIDPRVISQVIDALKQNNADYASNVNPRSFPKGLDVEIMTFQSLARSWREAQEQEDREHVTLFIRKRDDFKKANVVYKDDLTCERWTVDHPEDFTLIENIYKRIYKDNSEFGLEDILAIKNKEPEWFFVNRKHHTATTY